MKGVLENGTIVRNKKEALVEGRRYLDRQIESGELSKEDHIFVMRYDSYPDIWFTLGYEARPDVVNHVQIKEVA